MNRYRVNFILPVFFSILVLLSCSTEKNTMITRGYHNLTSHYNIFFNGMQSMQSGEEKIEENFEEEYSRILPVYKASEFEQTGTITSDMERTIDKSTKVIELHSITSRPKRGGLIKRSREFYRKEEYNKWIDDCYILIGKSHYYLQRYLQSIEAFKYIVNNFEYEEKKYDALVWLMRTYTENGDLKDAAVTISQIEKEREFPDRLQGEYNAAYAYYYLEQEMYNEAVPKLQNAIEEIREKEKEVRYTYILAQVYEELENYHQASIAYGKVVKHNPPYEMAFNAKINQASLMDVSRGNTDEVKKELLKMLKDDKNIDYQDQIYYALAQLEYKEGNISQAIEYYRRSAAKSVDNNNQKVMSYLKLADIYFNRQSYSKAGAYYDSTASFIDDDFPDYEEILTNTRNLNQLVQNLNIIEFEDSVQQVAQLSEAEQTKLVNNLIAQYRDEEKRKQQQAANNRNYRYQNNRNFRNNITSSGKWYFYNPSALSYGQSEFEKKWGKRKLEDNWRRKNKRSGGFQSSFAMDESSEESEDSVEVIKNQYSQTNPKYYTQNIPNTPEKLEASNQRLAEAYYHAGKIYQDRLDNPEKAIEVYENLVTRFPDNINTLPGLYELYVLHRKQGNMNMAEQYKDRIVSEYPESNYAKLLTNPNFLKELARAERERENFYMQTYMDYMQGNYQEVMQHYETATDKYKSTYLYPNFEFLNVVARGKMTNNRIFKNMLSEYKTKYPDHELSAMADSIINKIEEREVAMAMRSAEESEGESASGEETSGESEEEIIYSYDPGAEHFFVIVVRNDVDINQLRFNFISFIVDYYNLDDFDIENEPLTSDFTNLAIKSFENVEKANLFYKRLLNDPEVLQSFDDEQYQYFLISSNNYSKFIEDKSVRYYLEFFNKEYTVN